MPSDRFYADNALEPGSSLVLGEGEARHLVQVMRGRVGERVTLVNGRGVLAEACLCSLKKQQCTLEILSVATESPPAFQVILGIGLTRANRLDYVLEKGTELGATAFWLFSAEKGERQELSPQQLERLKLMTIAAMKQCGRLYLPEVVWKPPLKKWEALAYPCLYGDPDSSRPWLLKQLEVEPVEGGLIFCVGPEAGFSTGEKEALSTLGAEGVRLHRNILRADTAPLVALSLIDTIRTPRESN